MRHQGVPEMAADIILRARFLRNRVFSGMFSHRPNKIGKCALAA